MSFSRETQDKIKRFAGEQSQHYLEEAEMTYMEKLRRKTGESKDKISRKLSRFKGRSDKGLEAENDMVLYISDYMNDLLSEGLSEQEAFARASEAMKQGSGSEQSADLNERLLRYIQNRDPAELEVIGVLYGGFTIIGMTVGGLIGFLFGGGRVSFLSGGWIDTIIGAAIGLFLGVGLGLISHGVISSRTRR